MRVLLSSGSLKMIANNPEQEEAEEEVSEYSGEDLEIGFNVSYLLDVLNVLKGDNVRLSLSDANSSALVEDTTNDNAVYGNAHAIVALRVACTLKRHLFKMQLSALQILHVRNLDTITLQCNPDANVLLGILQRQDQLESIYLLGRGNLLGKEILSQWFNQNQRIGRCGHSS